MLLTKKTFLKEEDISKTVNEIFRYIKQSTKKTLVNKILTKLLQLEFKSDNKTKLKAIKFVVKKYCPIISNNGNVFLQL